MSALRHVAGPEKAQAFRLHFSVLATSASASPSHRSTTSRDDPPPSPMSLANRSHRARKSASLPSLGSSARAAAHATPSTACRASFSRPTCRPASVTGAPCATGASTSSRHRLGTISAAAVADSFTPRPGTRSPSTNRTASTARSARLVAPADTHHRAIAPRRALSTSSGGDPELLRDRADGLLFARVEPVLRRGEPRSSQNGAHDAGVYLAAVDFELDCGAIAGSAAESTGVRLRQAERRDERGGERALLVVERPVGGEHRAENAYGERPVALHAGHVLLAGFAREQAAEAARAKLEGHLLADDLHHRHVHGRRHGGHRARHVHEPRPVRTGHPGVRLPLHRRRVRGSSSLQQALERLLRVACTLRKNEHRVLGHHADEALERGGSQVGALGGGEVHGHRGTVAENLPAGRHA